MAKTPAFIDLKDHKLNFMLSHLFRLINSCKSELGKISKIILEKTNDALLKSLNLTDKQSEIFHGRGGFVELGRFDKHFVKTHGEEKVPQGKIRY